MAFKHLLVHVDSSRRAAERIDLAAALARRHGARLAGLFAETDTLGGSLVGRRSPDLMLRAAAEARADFEGRVRAAGLQAEWWPLEPAELGPLLGEVEICCRYADLAILGQPDREDGRAPEGILEHAIFGSGRPVLAVPAVGHYPDAGRRVLVGWNGSREAARALNDALPFLADADAVQVLSLQRSSRGGRSALPPVDVGAHLAAHGIVAKVERIIVDSEEIDVADVLLNRSFDLQTDLTVAGGYLQHGLPGPRAGASTRKLLESMTTPILFSH
jgi:nucleotide-binding universal stress UspA family protein